MTDNLRMVCRLTDAELDSWLAWEAQRMIRVNEGVMS